MYLSVKKDENDLSEMTGLNDCEKQCTLVIYIFKNWTLNRTLKKFMVLFTRLACLKGAVQVHRLL